MADIKPIKREFDKDGYYTIPTSKNYPGLVARRLENGTELVASGDPTEARQAIDAKAEELLAEPHPTGS